MGQVRYPAPVQLDGQGTLFRWIWQHVVEPQVIVSRVILQEYCIGHTQYLFYITFKMKTMPLITGNFIQ